MKKQIISLLLATSMVSTVSTEEQEKKYSLFAPQLKGVVLFGDIDTMRLSDVSNTEGLETMGLEIPGELKDLKEKIEPIFLNLPLSDELIQEIKQAVILYYSEKNRPVVMIQLLEQDISHHVLSFLVTESKLGKIEATGGRWFTDKQLVESLRLKPDSPIDQGILLEDLEWINRNPFIQADAVYSPGEKPGTTDIQLIASERYPLRVYAGAENSGLQDTGPNRYFSGFNWGNAFNFNHVLSLQYTTTDTVKDFQAVTVHYTAPLSWRRSTLFIYGGYSKVHANLHHAFKNRGHSIQTSARFEVPLYPLGRWLGEISAGFDFKRMNNTVEFSSVPVFGKNVTLTQFQLGYKASFESRYNQFSLSGELLFSPFSWWSDQTKQDFESLRPEANNKYLYGQLYLTDIYTLPIGISFYGTMRGQLSTANLLASEQFGLGGYSTVRGYQEREVVSDDALLLSGEIRSPNINPLKAYKIDDKLQFLAFVDYGLAHNRHLVDDEESTEFLASAGPGLRYLIGEYVTARADWGIRLHRDHFRGGAGRLHFGLIVSY